MQSWKILIKLLLITLLALSASGVVSAKVASGLQNLGPGLHQGETAFNPLTHRAKIEFSTTLTPGSPVVTNSGAKWNNGWRTPDGKFASPNGAGRGGAAAEQSVWDAVKQKPGWSVIEGQVGVRNASGQLRYYDGAAVSPRGRVIGLEVKSGSATKTPAQRGFDSGVNTYNPAVGVGRNQGLEVGRSLEIRR